MKKLRFSLILLFCFGCSTAQNNIKVTYGVFANEAYIGKQKDSTRKDKVQKIFEEAQENFKYIKYTLLIDGEEALFSMNESLEREGLGSMGIAKSLAGLYDMTYYSNSNKNLMFFQNDTYGKSFLVHSDFDHIKWHITRDTKTILGFNTYKAYGYKTVENDKIKVTAWFAPKLSMPFGPGGYGNLPGLILELTNGGKTYVAENIQQINKNITKPTKGKKITLEKFRAIGRKMTKNR